MTKAGRSAWAAGGRAGARIGPPGRADGSGAGAASGFRLRLDHRLELVDLALQLGDRLGLRARHQHGAPSERCGEEALFHRVILDRVGPPAFPPPHRRRPRGGTDERGVHRRCEATLSRTTKVDRPLRVDHLAVHRKLLSIGHQSLGNFPNKSW
jgi:hypothetical protein